MLFLHNVQGAGMDTQIHCKGPFMDYQINPNWHLQEAAMSGIRPI